MSTSRMASSKPIMKNKQTIKILVDEYTTCLRSLSPSQLRFEVEYGLEKGSSTNSFLIFTSQNKAQSQVASFLIHPPSISFEKEFINAFNPLITTYSSPINIVMGHINPKRVALIKVLAKTYKNLTIYCSSPGAKIFQEIWQQRKPNTNSKNTFTKIPKIHIVQKEERIMLENEYSLKLIPIPTARWPGGLIVFEETSGLLMSDKLFGAHLCTKEWAESNSLSTEEERRHYYDCLMAPMSNQVDSIVEQVEELEIKTIAPGNGPAIEGSWRSLLNDYHRWGESQANNKLQIVLIFASAYGNTASIADALAKGISKTGIKVHSINCEFTSPNELIKQIQQSDGYLIGSPTLGGHAPTPIVSALGTLLSEGDRTKPSGIFGSYGWSGEALDLLESKLKDGGFTFGFEPIKVKFSPDAGMIKTIEETGTLFGRGLIQKQIRQQRKVNSGLNTSKSDPTVIALGRVIGSLCVLTAQKGESETLTNGAMVASWVSQASFSPPGISISVAKDRAVESLLHKGDCFAINILDQENHQPLLRQFLKTFKPGEDRFIGCNITYSPGNQPILPQALAWLEGIVSQRMECGDHWLIYAEIKHGKVMNPKGITAIHHRKTGANY